MDIKTLILCNALVPFFLFLALVFFWYYQKTYPGFVQWTIATLVVAIAFLLLLLRPIMPLWVNIIVMNSFFLCGALLRLGGVVRFMSGQSLRRGWYAGLVLCFGALFFFYFVIDVISLRTYCVSIFFFLMGLRGGVEVIRFAPRESRPQYLATSGIYFFAGLIVLVRSISVLMEKQFSMFDPGTLYAAFFLLAMFIEIAFGLSFLMMNSQRLEAELRRSEVSLADTVSELKKTLAEVKTLQGFIPICANCKKIRDDAGYWQQVEKYISDHSEARFSHGICPDCLQKLYPDIAQKVLEDK